MLKILRRFSSALTAAALAFSAASAIPVVSAAEDDDSNVIFSDECENLTLSEGTTVWTSIYENQLPGYSGEGFVYLTNGSMSFEVEVPEEGMYDISVRYAQILSGEGGKREQTISVNDTKRMVDFPYSKEWKDISFGIFRFKKGVNKIEFLPQYGYAAFDTVTVSKAVFPELEISPELSDKNATPETQGLMNYLCDVYGDHIISGQQEIYGGGHTQDSPNGYSGDELLGYESEFEWIKKNFGAYPAIRGFDLMNYNPLYGWDDGSTERIIEWGTERNGIPTVCWHINLPTDFDSYTLGEPIDWSKCSYKNNSTFSVANAVKEGTKEHDYVMLTIDCLAQELLKVQEAGVPVIFRPYHEAEGNGGINGEGAWFWWSQEGAETYKALWRQLYTTLTEEYGIHNLIWEFNSYTYSTSSEWYPGDEWVDIVGFDKYNTVYNRNDGKTSGPNEDAISDTFYSLVNLTNNKKLVSMPENDTVPSLGNLQIEKAGWLYFCIWYDNGSENFLSGTDKNDPETLKELYQSDYCITLEELPDWKNYKITENPDPTSPSVEPTENPDIDFIPGDTTGDKIINVFDSVKLRNSLITSMSGAPAALPPHTSPEDVTGNGVVQIEDLVLLNQYLLGQDVELTYYKG